MQWEWPGGSHEWRVSSQTKTWTLVVCHWLTSFIFTDQRAANQTNHLVSSNSLDPQKKGTKTSINLWERELQVCLWAAYGVSLNGFCQRDTVCMGICLGKKHNFFLMCVISHRMRAWTVHFQSDGSHSGLRWTGYNFAVAALHNIPTLEIKCLFNIYFLLVQKELTQCL